ncbi:tetratricopeptide (TPR) repeat protein [Hamadaea flava]|uniref:Tetratricopeptide repeat protein n=1 Tax=Hamadaea flava TaxID=1742688 RepID=A0ABV8M026_9ACTN|nr:tetratricopeptide repeat protein [Hamadaea flava]MCP2328858.1 tetratricopeptide (TPR) repeat protein [Hamadaea flava]
MKAFLAVIGVAAALTLGAALLVPTHTTLRPATAQPVKAQKKDQVAQLQQRLGEVPGDWRSWAALGVAYVEKARTTADPAYYPKADGALAESVRLRPGNADGLAGQAALANARHDFTAARDRAQRALAADPYHSIALAAVADAYTQLGEPDKATDAVQRLLDIKPGLPAYARGAYDLEQHGRTADAVRLWQLALESVSAAEDRAFIEANLGDLTKDAAHYRAALAAEPGNAQATAGLARLENRLDLWAQVTARTPAPTLLIEYADALAKAGRTDEAQTRLALAEAGLRLFAEAGGRDDLGEAELAVAEGDYEKAVAAARREWQRRKFADVADVLAWALHLAGRHAEALDWIHLASKLGNPKYAAHRSAIEGAKR